LSTDQPGKAQLKNAVGGQVAFLLAALTQEKEGNTVYIANDKEEAAYMQKYAGFCTGFAPHLSFPGFL
jgi:hypothetical protein